MQQSCSLRSDPVWFVHFFVSREPVYQTLLWEEEGAVSLQMTRNIFIGKNNGSL